MLCVTEMASRDILMEIVVTAALYVVCHRDGLQGLPAAFCRLTCGSPRAPRQRLRLARGAYASQAVTQGQHYRHDSSRDTGNIGLMSSSTRE